MSMRVFTVFALACLGLAACTGRTAPQNTVTPQLNSGITSQNGGGMRALQNNNSVGQITTPVR